MSTPTTQSEEDWEARMDKWGFGIDVTTCDVDDLKEYINTKIRQYEIDKMSDNGLWRMFREDFKNFTPEIFAKLHHRVLSSLSLNLRCAGVWVPSNNQRLSYAMCLTQVLQEETRHEWTMENIREAREDFLKKPITSVYIDQDGFKYLPPLRPPPDQLPSSPLPQTATHTTTSPTSSAVPQPVQPQLPNPLPLQLPRQTSATPSYQTTSIARQISEIAKIYTDDQKYDGTNSSFDYSLTIFRDICERVELPEDALMRAFPTMLKGLARDHFYNNKLSQRSFGDVCNNFKNFFERPGYHRRNLDKWNSINLSSIMASNPEKGTYKAVQLLINDLRKLQYGLLPPLQTPDFLHNKIVTACQGSPACRYAVSDPPNDLGQLINKLQSSIISYEKENQGIEQLFTDRRFHQNSSSLSQSNNGPQTTRQPFPKGKCFICHLPGCRSWKHTSEEQDQAKAKFRTKYASRFNTNTPQATKRFNERFKQYVVDYEGEDLDSIDLAFETLIIEDSDDEPDQSKESSTTYITSYFANTATFALKAMTQLSDSSLFHKLTKALPAAPALGFPDPIDPVTTPGALDAFLTTSRYDSHCFYGVMVDTGAAKRSTAGLGQFQALQQINKTIEINHLTKGQVTVQFGIGETSSIGSTKISTPIGQVEFHIVNANTPFLLSLADMDRLHVYVNNLTDHLITPNGPVPIVRRFGHLFLLWDASLESFITESFNQNPCFLTDVELRRLHRRFGHPSVSRLHRVLERAGHDVDEKALSHLTKYCEQCQRFGKPPNRFRFTLRDDLTFNHSIIVDIFYINGKPVLHVIDEETRYQAGRWLESISAKHTWDALRACWIDTYLGPPETITTDAGKNFVSQEFSEYASTMGITLQAVPIESHNSIGMVERYHGFVRRAYTIIAIELPDLHKDMALQMAFKAVNDTAGPDGLVPTLLVYGAFPRISDLSQPSPTTTQRATAIKKATEEIQKLRAKRQVNDAIAMRNGPTTGPIHDLPLNSDVLVWREGNGNQTGRWDGPYRLVSTSGESCVLVLPNGCKTFRSTSIKPFLVANADGLQMNGEYEEEPVSSAPPMVEPPTSDTIVVEQPPQFEQPRQGRRRGRPPKYPVDTGSPNISVFVQRQQQVDQHRDQFTKSRQAEISGLLEKGVFETVPLDSVPQGTRIFNSRFVDDIKNKGTPAAFEKSRLVVQAYNDQEKQLVLTQSPTIQRVSQRIILCLAAMGIGDVSLYSRDISQAYVQSTTQLNRDFFVRPPPELSETLGLGQDHVLKVVKPLYGVPEAGNHWFKTYHSHHVNKLLMSESTYDPCLLYSNNPFGVVGLQTDDTLFVADSAFVAKEEDALREAGFLAKDREQLSTAHPIKFNGGLIKLDPDSISLTQERQCANLQLVGKTATTTSSRGTVRQGLSIKEQYVAQRARGAYIATVCQPEAAFDLSIAAQAINPTDDDVKALNKRLLWQLENAARGIQFVKLDQESLQLLVFTDASFANNKDLTSQIGFVIALADATGRANLLHWSSVKCKRVTRSVLASELYAMAHGFDSGASIKSTLDKILALPTDLPLVLCTDSKSLYDCLVKLGTTQEKRLMIDVMCLRQAYERREIGEVRWIKGESNPADSMTKGKPSTALKRLIDDNTVQLEVVEWVERADN